MIAVLHPILATLLALVTAMPASWCCAAGFAETASDERAAGCETGATCCRAVGAANSERSHSQQPVVPQVEPCCCSAEAVRLDAEQVVPEPASTLSGAQPEAVVLQPNMVATTAPMANLFPPPHRILHCVWRL